MADATYQPKVYKTSGGDKQVVASGGELDIESGGALKLAGTQVTATADEINNACDVSVNSQSITAAGAIELDAKYVSIAGGTGFAVTLAAPTAAQAGQTKVITLASITSGAVTLALTNVIGGSAGTSASFDAANETLTLVAITGKWVVIDEHGVTLS